MGMEMWAIFKSAKSSEIWGNNLSRMVPAMIQKPTQTERYLSQRPSLLCSDCPLRSAVKTSFLSVLSYQVLSSHCLEYPFKGFPSFLVLREGEEKAVFELLFPLYYVHGKGETGRKPTLFTITPG